MKTPVLLSCVIIIHAAPLAAQRPERVKASDIRPERELLITAPEVVDSERAVYPGPWSFGGLIEELVGKEKAPELLSEWLRCYYRNSTLGQSVPSLPRGVIPQGPPPPRLTTQVTMGNCATQVVDRSTPLVIPGRPDFAQKFVRTWQERDNYDPKSGKEWRPNPANAPFRLLAIVNRMDLSAPAMAGIHSEVEGRWKIRGKDQEFKRMVNLMGSGSPFEEQSGTSSSGGYGSFSTETPTAQQTDFGEGRLIFGAVDRDGRPLEGGWTLIFEYKLRSLPKMGSVAPVKRQNKADAATDPSRLSVRDWAQAWHWLGGLDTKDPRYAEELEKITRAFTHRRSDTPTTAAPALPPDFAQLRSSEAAFGPGREFRQFELRTDRLVPAALPMTPAPQFAEDTREGGRALARFLHDVEPLILAGVHTLPVNLRDNRAPRPFLAGHAIIPAGEPACHWEPKPRVSRDARRIFSTATCNGCHAADTGCAEGLHVHPREAGQPAKLSSFLRMDGQANQFADPGQKASTIRQREMEDRAAILAAFLEPRDSKRLDALTDTLRERLRRGH